MPVLTQLLHKRKPGADLGFFLGGGAPLRNDVIGGEVKKLKSDHVYMKEKASSQGGGGLCTPCTLPLELPLETVKSSEGRHHDY